MGEFDDIFREATEAERARVIGETQGAEAVRGRYQQASQERARTLRLAHRASILLGTRGVSLTSYERFYYEERGLLFKKRVPRYETVMQGWEILRHYAEYSESESTLRDNRVTLKPNGSLVALDCRSSYDPRVTPITLENLAEGIQGAIPYPFTERQVQLGIGTLLLRNGLAGSA